MVSQARMSTRVTLTMFLPCPNSYASAGKSTEMGVATRARGATSAKPIMTTATARPIPRRTHRLAASGRFEK